MDLVDVSSDAIATAMVEELARRRLRPAYLQHQRESKAIRQRKPRLLTTSENGTPAVLLRKAQQFPSSPVVVASPR